MAQTWLLFPKKLKFCLGPIAQKRTFSSLSQAVQPGFPVTTRLDVGGYTINTVKTGYGPHAVFLLPGILGCMEQQLSPQINGFNKDKFTIYSWDQPGYAGSQSPARTVCDHSLAEDSELLVAVLKEFGHEKYSLLGWSAGGLTALVTAINYPELITKLVVWGAWAEAREVDAKRFQWFRNTSNLGGKMKDTLVDFYGLKFFEQEWDRWMQVFIRIYTQHGGDFCASRLDRIQCPTLIIHGEDDGLIPPDHGEFLHKNIRDSRLHIWQRGKHNVHLRFPLEFNRLVQHFLTE